MTRRRGARSAAVVRPDWRPAVATLLAIAAATVSGTTLARAGGNIEAVVNGNTQIADAVWSPLALPIPWRLNNQGVINNRNNGNPLCAGGVSPLTLGSLGQASNGAARPNASPCLSAPARGPDQA